MKNIFYLFLLFVIYQPGDSISNSFRHDIAVVEKSEQYFHNEAGMDSNLGTESAIPALEKDESCNITTIISKPSGEISSENFPDPYPTNCQWTYTVHVGERYKIRITVMHFDLEEGDTLLIEPIVNAEKTVKTNSPSMNNGSTNVNETFELNMDCCDSAIIKFIVGNHSNNHSGFSLSYSRFEKLDQPNSTIIIIPGWCQAYICGVTVYEFAEIEDEFKQSLQQTVEEYALSNELVTNRLNTAMSEILINGILPCPTSWPSSLKCVQLNFSAILSDNALELISDHLMEVWKIYRSTKGFLSLGIWEYEIPDVEWFFWFWIFLLGFVSLIFCVVLMLLVKTKLIYYYFQRMKIQQTNEENTNFVRWNDHQSMALPFFTAENSNRFNFLKEYEEINNAKSGIKRIQVSSGIYSDLKQRTDVQKDVVDDFDSDENNHIYHTLH